MKSGNSKSGAVMQKSRLLNREKGPMIDSVLADRIAYEIHKRLCETLDEARCQGKLDALAYSARSNEKWLVLETYWRVFRDWNSIRAAVLSEGYGWCDKNWDWHMELGYPSGCGKMFDLGLGPSTERNEVNIAQQDTVVFQAKMVRTFTGTESIDSVRSDVEWLEAEKMLNGYLLLLHIVGPKKDKAGLRKWVTPGDQLKCIEACKAGILGLSERIRPIGAGTPYGCGDWGPFPLDLSKGRKTGEESWLFSSCEYCVFAQTLRVLPLPSIVSG